MFCLFDLKNLNWKYYKNNETPTKAKIKRAKSANLKDNATNKFYGRLPIKCSELPANF